jgi:hypothetical protein
MKDFHKLINTRLKNEKAAPNTGCSLFSLFRMILLRMDCLYGTNVCASSAVSANFRVDFIDIAFGNSFYGTFIDAGSACDAIVIDYMSHG